ncbi:hypothetical protein V6N12_022521 [Hibiscus sabdariffa]|uniref:Uncharacterized protein n=1 Tax=Hibiscus sabdariffa TaxID=183260 RepID=A0ABR2FUY4_9ROSI
MGIVVHVRIFLKQTPLRLMFKFARTRSGPELTESYGKSTSQGKRQSYDTKLSSSASNSFVSSSRVSNSDTSTKVQHKFSGETQGSTREDRIDVYRYQGNRGGDVDFD